MTKIIINAARCHIQTDVTSFSITKHLIKYNIFKKLIQNVKLSYDLEHFYFLSVTLYLYLTSTKILKDLANS